jgi:hypothetical protein
MQGNGSMDTYRHGTKLHGKWRPLHIYTDRLRSVRAPLEAFSLVLARAVSGFKPCHDHEMLT